MAPLWNDTLFSPFYRWGNWGLGRISDLFKASLNTALSDSQFINWLLYSEKPAICFLKFCLLLFFKESHAGALIIQLKSQSRKKCLKEPLDLFPVFIHVLSLNYQFKNLSASSSIFNFGTKSDSVTLFHLCQLSWISRDSAKPFL